MSGAEMDGPILNPDDWSMAAGFEAAYPFVEDEDANITGLGHQDKAEFAAAINRYDTEMHGEPFPEGEQWTPDDITHQWGLLGERDGEPVLFRAKQDALDAVAITTLWGQR